MAPPTVARALAPTVLAVLGSLALLALVGWYFPTHAQGWTPAPPLATQPSQVSAADGDSVDATAARTALGQALTLIRSTVPVPGAYVSGRVDTELCHATVTITVPAKARLSDPDSLAKAALDKLMTLPNDWAVDVMVNTAGGDLLAFQAQTAIGSR